MELYDSPKRLEADESEFREVSCCGLEELPPPDVFDPVIAAYTKDVDRTLLIENLKLTPAQRAEKLESFMEMLMELREATKSWRTWSG
ncbi:MAG: hypothetical protein KJ070_08045 [Verrucomicrobia bacterium]|nr:hypothetical protein [Verrucomicrobiota bacterium]